MPSNRAFDFEVQGRYPFPVDMLRYDRCCPLGSDDAQAIYSSIADQGTKETFTIRLRAYAASGFTEPSAERWTSFGWSVVPGSLRIVP